MEKYASKDKVIAVLLALIGGGLGLHKFYLRRPAWGIIYLLFSWTGLPAILGVIEGIYYILMSEDSFNKKYSS